MFISFICYKLCYVCMYMCVVCVYVCEMCECPKSVKIKNFGTTPEKTRKTGFHWKNGKRGVHPHERFFENYSEKSGRVEKMGPLASFGTFFIVSRGRDMEKPQPVLRLAGLRISSLPYKVVLGQRFFRMFSTIWRYMWVISEL